MKIFVPFSYSDDFIVFVGFGGMGGGILVVVVGGVCEVLFSGVEDLLFVSSFRSSFVVTSSFVVRLSLSSTFRGDAEGCDFCRISAGMMSALLSPMRISLR